MDIQTILVIAVVVGCLLFAAKRVKNTIKNIKDKDNPCAHCATGCDLKRMMDEKRKNCTKQEQNNCKS